MVDITALFMRYNRFLERQGGMFNLLTGHLYDWPTSISTGVLTCAHGLCGLDEIIFAADKLMYEVKASGKNSVRFVEYGDGAGAIP